MKEPLRRLAVVALCVLAACDADRAATVSKPAPSQSERAPELLRGWYHGQASSAIFETCGQARRWQVDSAELRRQAIAFAETHGLEEVGPVYVVVLGTVSADGTKLTVTSVKQFGSATPLRDCGLTGVVTDTPADR